MTELAVREVPISDRPEAIRTTQGVVLAAAVCALIDLDIKPDEDGRVRFSDILPGIPQMGIVERTRRLIEHQLPNLPSHDLNDAKVALQFNALSDPVKEVLITRALFGLNSPDPARNVPDITTNSRGEFIVTDKGLGVDCMVKRPVRASSQPADRHHRRSSPVPDVQQDGGDSFTSSTIYPNGRPHDAVGAWPTQREDSGYYKPSNPYQGRRMPSGRYLPDELQPVPVEAAQRQSGCQNELPEGLAWPLPPRPANPPRLPSPQTPETHNGYHPNQARRLPPVAVLRSGSRETLTSAAPTQPAHRAMPLRHPEARPSQSERSPQTQHSHGEVAANTAGAPRQRELPRGVQPTTGGNQDLYLNGYRLDEYVVPRRAVTPASGFSLEEEPSAQEPLAVKLHYAIRSLLINVSRRERPSGTTRKKMLKEALLSIDRRLDAECAARRTREELPHVYQELLRVREMPGKQPNRWHPLARKKYARKQREWKQNYHNWVECLLFGGIEQGTGRVIPPIATRTDSKHPIWQLNVVDTSRQ